MHGTVTAAGTTTTADRATVEAKQSAGEFFWLDLDGVDDEARQLLDGALGVHQLVLRDVQAFGQRPKCNDYDGMLHMVVHGAGTGDTPTAEIHFIITPNFVVTVHRGDCPALEEVRRRVGYRDPAEIQAPHIVLIYLVIDRLVDSFFPQLDEFDNRIDELEDAVLAQPTEQQLGTLFAMKRTLIGLRKVIAPQRDMFGSIAAGVTELPGVSDDGLRYLRDIYDHLIRLSDLVDGYRDLLSGVMDTHLSTVSNRLNVVMKQLTIIATVFLPLSFLTGFFGQNFGWLVNNIGGVWRFLVFGIGLEVVAVFVLVYLFRKRGWLGGDAT